MDRFRNATLVALTASLMAGTAAAASQDVTSAAANRLASDATVAIADGGRLERGARDVLVDQHGLCRWLDNAGSAQYFVPYKTPLEWASFVTSAPSDVVRAGCCPAKTVSLTASNGSTQAFSLATGREGATGSRGRMTFTNTFVIDGTTSENISQSFVCRAGAWQADAPVIVAETLPTSPEVPEVNGGCYTDQDVIVIQDATGSYVDDIPSFVTAYSTLSQDSRVENWKFTTLTFGSTANDVNKKFSDIIRTKFSRYGPRILSPLAKASGKGVGSTGQMPTIAHAMQNYVRTNPHTVVLLATDDADLGNKSFGAYRSVAAQALRNADAELIVLQGKISGVSGRNMTNVAAYYTAFMNEYGIKGRIVPLAANSANLYDKIMEGVCVH